MRPHGFIIDVPVTLSVSVRGTTVAEAKRIAREFADTLSPADAYCSGYTDTAQYDGFISRAVSVTEATLEFSQEEPCKVRGELVEDNED
jgi:hypothetical protein